MLGERSNLLGEQGTDMGARLLRPTFTNIT